MYICKLYIFPGQIAQGLFFYPLIKRSFAIVGIFVVLSLWKTTHKPKTLIQHPKNNFKSSYTEGRLKQTQDVNLIKFPSTGSIFWAQTAPYFTKHRWDTMRNDLNAEQKTAIGQSPCEIWFCFFSTEDISLL